MTADTQKTPGKIMGVVGVLFGLFLYFLWFVAIMAIMFTFFTAPIDMGVSMVTFPLSIRTWLIAGALPFFILFGHYVCCRGEITETDLLHTRSGLIGSLLGFFLWLAVLTVLEAMGIAAPYSYNLAGGFLVILILIMIFWKVWSREE